MKYSYSRGEGTGSKRDFSFHFEGQDEGYLRKEDISVFVNDVLVPFAFTSSNTVSLDEAPPDGADVLIRRIMPKDLPYADFKRGNNFGQETLNNSFLQLLYIVQEILDGWFPEGFIIRGVTRFKEDVTIESDLNVEGGVSVKNSNPENPDSVVTYRKADGRYVFVDGDTMKGPLKVLPSESPEDAVQKRELDKEIDERKSEDETIRTSVQDSLSNIQEQLTGEVPLEASAFSPISWHKQVIENSVTIPENKNAWSFGPAMSIKDGPRVYIKDGSVWTIANGDADPVDASISFDEGEL